ncbi:hypothetical protein BQ8794_110281 [Mesorhizobium prunaredense]|uniref:Uncharacterized protein n=1 Tax=Mesorhizobium prunaredense TaxID=1631249 RepID=A0A1R3V0Q7_9HYPH|nr:hypothetical protein BQ8794_110281 [Mesorhizobium prunaredense]
MGDAAERDRLRHLAAKTAKVGVKVVNQMVKDYADKRKAGAKARAKASTPAASCARLQSR